MGNSRKSKNPVAAEWAELLADARDSEASGPPQGAGWMSREDLMRELRCGASTLSNMAKKLISAGALEKRKFRTWTGCRWYPMTYYRRLKK